jgi:hypothetical protein
LMSSAWLPGIMGPDTAPCNTRNAIKEGKLQAAPHRNDAMVKRVTESTNVRTTPKRCMSQPVKGTETPLATANEVMTQVPWSELTPKFPAIVGIDTLAMEVSSTCMNVPTASAKAVIALALPARVGGAASAATTALTALSYAWRRACRPWNSRSCEACPPSPLRTARHRHCR